MSKRNPAVICLSGGMDSTSLLLRLLSEQREVYALSFDYGQKHKLELQRLQDNLAYLKRNEYEVQWDLVELSKLGSLFHSALTTEDWSVPEGHYADENMKQTVVPNRNAIFASIAYGYALSIATRESCQVNLSLGVHSGDHAIYPDCRPEFYEALLKAFELGNWDSENVSLHLPYLDWDKAKILQDAKRAVDELKLDFDTVFRNTITSYAPAADGRSSGLTGSDVERILAFHDLGRPDPIEYVQSWPKVVEQALALQKAFEQSAENKVN